MAGIFRRQRKRLALVVLATWLFGLFVGIAHACGLDGAMAMPESAPAGQMSADDSSTGRAPPGCEQFCNDDLPLVAKVQGVQDPPTGHTLLVASPHDAGLAPVLAPASAAAMTAQPPRVAPPPLRFVRLTL